MVRFLKIFALLPLVGLFVHCNSSKLNAPAEQQFLIGTTPVGIQSVVTGLNVPWQILWGPDQQIWFTEQSGKISTFNPETGKTKVLLQLGDVIRERTSGLLGMMVHPDLKGHPYVFINYTGRSEKGDKVSKLLRYTYDAVMDTLMSPKMLLEYPAWTSHFGARMVIAPDGKLMVATGDGMQHDNAQNIKSPNGKILRYNIDGTIPSDNPFQGNPVWAWGLRNPQGFVYAGDKLYCSDHGDAIEDEVNLVKKGANYGWPFVEGYVDTEAEKLFAKDSVVTEPLKAWTPTIAPAGLGWYSSDKIPELKGSLLLTTLKGNSLRALSLNASGTAITKDLNYFEKIFGRLRSACVSPSGDVYIATSNRDWNPNAKPADNDDRIIRIYRLDAKHADPKAKSAVVAQQNPEALNKGALLYTNYCASCHKEDGKGIKNTFPALDKAAIVSGPKVPLIHTVKNGRNAMPAFSFMDDKELAVLLTYVRQKFGVGADEVTAKDVQSVKK